MGQRREGSGLRSNRGRSGSRPRKGSPATPWKEAFVKGQAERRLLPRRGRILGQV